MTTAKKAVKAAEPVLEEVAEVLDEQIETIARIPRLRLNGTTRTQQIVILGVTAAVGAAAGAGVTYFAIKKRLELKFDKELEAGIEEAREFYRRRNKQDEFANPVEALAHYKEEVDKLGYGPQGPSETELASDIPADKVVVEAPVTIEVKEEDHNIFLDSKPVTDFTPEERDETKPHVIPEEDFLMNDLDYDQNNLVYYLKDGTMADEQDGIIPDDQVSLLIGDDNLLRFGHGSNDNNTVFVRNHDRKMEFQIIRSTGSYAAEVHGFDDSEATLSHSDRHPRRFRQDRD